jgi:hypothetical protein
MLGEKEVGSVSWRTAIVLRRRLVGESGLRACTQVDRKVKTKKTFFHYLHQKILLN